MGAYETNGNVQPVAPQPFEYSGEMVNALTEVLSPARLSRYAAATATPVEALQLYAWNTTISAAFYGPLQAFEVALRNSVHAALSARYGDHWYANTSLFRPSEERSIQEAEARLIELRRAPFGGALVAELSFRFWIALFANRYDTSLWRDCLFRVFSPRIKNRHGLHNSLESLRTLRNRIAHHEPIFDRRLEQDYKMTMAVLGGLSPITLQWIQHHCRVPEVLAMRPGDVVRF